MTNQEIQTRIQSLKTIINLIDGKEFNAMKLTKPGACAYVIDGKPNESCIVGCAMKPEVRNMIGSGVYNAETVKLLFDERLLRANDMFLQGIANQEWRQLQIMFDNNSGDLEDNAAVLAKMRDFCIFLIQLEELC